MSDTSGATAESGTGVNLPAPPAAAFAHAGLEPFCDPVGRLAWHKPDAAAAAGLYGRSGYAIVRVEVWCLCNEDTYSAVIPYVDGQYGRFDWRQEEGWSPDRESWEQFCARCATWAASKVALANYEPHLTRDYGPEKMRIHFESVSRSEYGSE